MGSPLSVVNEPERLPTTSECGHHLLQIVKGRKQGIGVAAEGARWRTADPSRYPQQVCRGLAQLLLREQVDIEEAQWLAKQIGSRLRRGQREDVVSSWRLELTNGNV